MEAQEKESLAKVCAESGWRFEAAGSGELAVDLGVPAVYVAAHLSEEGESLLLRCEIARVVPKPICCRAAVQRLLALAGEAFRGVSAALEEGEDEAAAVCLEARCAAAPAALADALGSLAVAARRCAREAQALAADADLARAYLDHHAPR